MSRTRIKICGITRAEDALAAARLGADAVGFVLVPRSPRFISPEAAAIIRRLLPPFVGSVALLMDASAEDVEHALRVLRPDLLQFHGNETPAFCRAAGHPYLKAVAMDAGGEGVDLAAVATRYADAAGLLLDGHAPGEMGGSGRRVDLEQATAPRSGPPLVLAGGLRPDNVAEAVRRLRPWAVDVSSGVESAPGIKDAGLMKAFIDEVRRADEH